MANHSMQEETPGCLSKTPHVLRGCEQWGGRTTFSLQKLKESLHYWHFVLCIGLPFLPRWYSRRKNKGVDIITKRWSHTTHPRSCNRGVDDGQQHVANQHETADFSALRRRDTYCRIFIKTRRSCVQATYEDRRTDGVSEKREIPQASVDRENR